MINAPILPRSLTMQILQNSSAWKLLFSSLFHLQLFGEILPPPKKENRNETLQVCKLPYSKHSKWIGDKENIIYVEREMTQ